MGKSKSDSSDSSSDSSDSDSSSSSDSDAKKKKKKHGKSKKEKAKKKTSDSDSDKGKKDKRKSKKKSDSEENRRMSPVKQKPSQTEEKESGKALTMKTEPEEDEPKPMLALQDHTKHSQKGRRRNFRRERTALESDEDTETVKSTLQEAKLIQKSRKRGMGVCWTAEDEEELEKEEQELKSVIHGSATGGLVSANAMAFRAKTEEMDQKIETVKDQFIEEEITKIRMGDKQFAKRMEEEKQKDAPKKKSAEDELYEIPEFLKQEKEEIEESGDRWLTGIAEVPLPINVKLDNIERTEKAKHDMFLKKAEANKEFRPSTEGGNLSTNFKRNRMEWIQQRKDESSKYLSALNKKEGGGGPRDAPPPDPNRATLPRSSFASDDKVVDRFVKRYRYK